MSTLYSPGSNKSALRSGPNSLRRCTAYTLSICSWIAPAGMDGLKTRTLGPRSGLASGFESGLAPPAAIAGPAKPASKPTTSPHLVAIPRSLQPQSLQCFDFPIVLPPLSHQFHQRFFNAAAHQLLALTDRLPAQLGPGRRAIESCALRAALPVAIGRQPPLRMTDRDFDRPLHQVREVEAENRRGVAFDAYSAAAVQLVEILLRA